MDKTAIDPDIASFIATMQQDWERHPPFASLSFDEARAAAQDVRARWREGGPVMAETRDLSVETACGPLPVRIHYPVDADQLPVMVYLHGGGFTLFSIETHDRLMREYAAATGCAVIGVDYPLSPETKFPVALDRIAALVATLPAHAAQWNIDAARVVLAVDSAGANLAVATCFKLREALGEIPVTALLLNYGAFAHGTSDQAESRYGGADSILNAEEMDFYWANYLSSSTDYADPFACPLLGDMTGLPPAILIVPELDILSEQSSAIAAKMHEAGCEVQLLRYTGATHSFLEAMSISALAQRAITDGANFVRERTMDQSTAQKQAT